MKKLFTLAAAVLASLTVMAQTVLWETDCIETITGVSQTKGRSSDSWGDAPSWADPYTKAFLAGGSSSTLTFTFDEALSVPANAVLHVYWGATSNRTLTLQINGSDASYTDGNVVDNSTSKPRSTVMDATYTFASATTLNSFKIGTGGSNTFWLHIAITTTCSSPETPLSITSDASSPLYEGSTIHLTLAGGNGAAKHLQLDGVDFDYLTWMAEAGEHTFTVSQEAYDGYCPQEAELKLNVLSATPVSAVAIDGPTAGYIGMPITLTATAANATEYEWYIGGVKQGSDSAKLIFTPAAADTYSIICKARNEFNSGEWISSAAKDVVVTKLCGELIKATTQNVVTGVIGGTYDTNNGTGDTKKLNTNKYHGITLASGSFQAADTFKMTITSAAGSATEMGTMKIYADKAGTIKLFESENVGVVGENAWVLPAAVNGKKSLYIYRGGGNDWNPTFSSISVSRACVASSDATIAQLTVNDNVVAEEDGVFNYTVGASEDLATVNVAYVLNHPLATVKYDLPNPIVMNVPAAGTSVGQAITVIAEDGTEKTYTVNISKAAAASDNANLKELVVAGYTLDPVFDADVLAYTITKAYGAENPAVSAVTATPEDNNANAVVELAGDVFTITVTAEDHTAHKEYTITINEAEAPKSLSSVHFANGCEAFIDNTNHTVKAFYLAGTAAPEADAIVAGAGVAGALSEGKITVTGEDASTVDYTVTVEAVTPFTEAVASTADAGAFDGTEAWVKNGLLLYGNTAGFADGKYVLRRQLKSGDAADDQRVIAGWVRTYIFVGNASKLELANTTKNNAVKYAIDGGAYTETNTNPIVIALEEGNHMIEIVTNQSSGDCNLSAPKLVERTATAINNTEAEVKAIKVIENGQFFIIKNGIKYNANGAIVK